MPASDAGNEQTAECLQLAARDESQWFERKGGRLSARDLGDALVGFANAEGGLIALGVADDGRIEGASTDRINEWRQAAQRFTDPPVRHAFRALSCTNEAGEAVGIAVVEIEPAERPHTNAKGETFLRIGDATHRLGPAEAQELRYDKGDAAFDGRMSEAEDDALDDALTERYLTATGASSRARALTARGLAIEHDGALRATNAGLLLLGAQPQLQYPEACVRVLLHEGLGRETGARANVVEGSPLRRAHRVADRRGQRHHRGVAPAGHPARRGRALPAPDDHPPRRLDGGARERRHAPLLLAGRRPRPRLPLPGLRRGGKSRPASRAGAHRQHPPDALRQEPAHRPRARRSGATGGSLARA